MSKGTRGEVAEEQQTMTYDEKTWNAAISAAAKAIRETDEKGSRGYGALLDRLEERILSLPCPAAPATGETKCPECGGRVERRLADGAATAANRARFPFVPTCLDCGEQWFDAEACAAMDALRAPPSTAPGDEAGVCVHRRGDRLIPFGNSVWPCTACNGTGRAARSGR